VRRNKRFSIDIKRCVIRSNIWLSNFILNKLYNTTDVQSSMTYTRIHIIGRSSSENRCYILLSNKSTIDPDTSLRLICIHQSYHRRIERCEEKKEKNNKKSLNMSRTYCKRSGRHYLNDRILLLFDDRRTTHTTMNSISQ